MNAKPYGLSDSTGYLLGSVGSMIKTHFARKVAKYGVTSEQCPVLMVLYSGTCGTPTEMAKTIGVDVGAVSRLIDRLAHKKLVRRIPHEQDKRSVRVELTPEGRRLAPALINASNDFNNHIFGGALGKARARTFHKTLLEVSSQLTKAYQGEDHQNSQIRNRRK